jgi:hypothetical protein
MTMADKTRQAPAEGAELRRPFGRAAGKGMREQMHPADVIAVVLGVLWLVVVAAFFLLAEPGGPDAPGPATLVLTLLGVFLPIALIWIAALTLRSARMLRAEAADLQASIEGLRKAYIAQSQAHAAQGMAPDVARKLDEIAEAQKKTETAIAVFTSRRDPETIVASADRKAALAVPRPDPAQEQASLALGTPAEALAAPISIEDFLRALNFPENREDKAGFRALRLALEDPRVAKLIRASQDVLTLLSEDGIYMDDLRPDRTRPELWRSFAGGARGGAVAGLGGIRDRSCLALTTGRMREDPVFRDTAHHFLRQFDRMMVEFEKTASDEDLARLSDTRTARAFMLLGRVTGTFD